MRQLWERASGRRRFSIGVRHGRRPLALTLLVIGAAAGVLLQIGPAKASSKKARGPTASAASGRRSPPTASCRSPSSERGPARRARPLLGAGRALGSSSRAARPCSPSRRQAGRARALGSASSAPTRSFGSSASAAGRAGSTTCSATTRPSGKRTCAPTSASSTATSGRGSTWSSAGRAASSSTSSSSAPEPASAGSGSPTAARSGSRSTGGKPAHPDRARRPQRLAAGQLPARRRQASARREPLRARPARRLRLRRRRLRPPLPARHRPGPRSTPPTWAEAATTQLRHRGRRRRQRLRDREHGLDGLPDDSGRLRHDLERPDAFVTKLDASGAALVYSTYLGGTATTGG